MNRPAGSCWCLRQAPAVVFVLLAAGCALPGGGDRDASEAANIDRVVVAMGTTLRLQVAAPTRALALRASEDAVRAIEVVDARLSTWRADSELSELNRSLVGEYVTLSGALLRDLAMARRWSKATGGAFDPGIGALVDLYELRTGGAWPDDQDVWACLPHCGMQELHVIRTSASRRMSRLRIEEGGFGKGAGLEAAGRAVLAAGATAATFDFGGQVLLVGEQPANGDLQIADPLVRDRAVVRVGMTTGSSATTANSERRVEATGRSFGHILDPRTGRPAEDFGSVTVFAESPFAADCLSTALFVMGPDAALAWAEQQRGVEALVLEASRGQGSGQLTARMTSGLRGKVTALVPDITILQ